VKLTEKQKRFADYYIETGNATEAWVKTYGSLYGFKNLNLIKDEDPIGVVIDCICVLENEGIDVIRKYAAIVLLKALVVDDFRKTILENPDLFPLDREDYRVRTWRKKILSKGKCERCGRTENLEAHHIIRWADYPKGRIDINNGMCLCRECHAKEHKGEQSYYMMKGRLV
jgi:hypothetical protein